MADIRINALATTAASTASDDFIAVDGSANGTRKLNAYSPTFGGNLSSGARITANNGFTATATVPTVVAASTNLDYNSVGAKGRLFVWGPDAGTVAGFELNLANSTNSSLINALSFASSGDATFAGQVRANGSTSTDSPFSVKGNSNYGVAVYDSAQQRYIRIRHDGTDGIIDTTYDVGGAYTPLKFATSGTTRLTIAAGGDATFAGNLNVNGTASSFGGFANAGGAVYVRKDSGEVFRADAAGAGYRIVADQNGVDLGGARTTVGGNLLIGTTTDSANGKLQLATHTTSAGGIGFGTDTSLYRVSAGNVAVDSISGTNPVVLLREGSVNKGYFATSSGAMFIGTHTANSIQFQTNTTTALTLDSSQNATFAGRVKAGTAYGTAKSVEVNEAFTNQAQNTTKTVTVALPGGANGATFVLDVGAYGNSGTGYGSLLVKGAGYLGSSTTYDAAEIVKANSGSVTVSSVTKGNNQLTFTVINTAGTVSISVKLTATAGDDISTLPAITIA